MANDGVGVMDVDEVGLISGETADGFGFNTNNDVVGCSTLVVALTSAAAGMVFVSS